MKKSVGQSYPISPFRRLVIDLMHFSGKVPAAIASRQMDLGPVVAARRAWPARPSWAVLFTKAYAMLGRDYPMLRRAYLTFPWQRFYDHPHAVAALTVERRLADEDVVLYCLIRSPENRTLAELDAIVREHQEAPVETLGSYIRARRMSQVPWPLRRWFFWASLNLFGRRRCHNFGTFNVTSVGAHGAGLLNVTPLLTTSLHYGQLDERNRLDVRISWDHRVNDGAVVGRALTDLETILNRDIVRELTAGPGEARRAA